MNSIEMQRIYSEDLFGQYLIVMALTHQCYSQLDIKHACVMLSGTFE